MQNIGSNHQPFKNYDQPIKPQHKSETPLIMTAECDGQHRPDQRDHAAKGRDDLQQRPQQRPQRSKRNTDQLEADKPQASHDQRIERSCATPRHKSATGSLPSIRIPIFPLHANLLLTVRI